MAKDGFEELRKIIKIDWPSLDEIRAEVFKEVKKHGKRK